MLEKRKTKKSIETIKIPNKTDGLNYIYSCYSNNGKVKVLIHTSKETELNLNSELVLSYECEAGGAYISNKNIIKKIFEKLLKSQKLSSSELINEAKEAKISNLWTNSRLERRNSPSEKNQTGNKQRHYNKQGNNNYDEIKKANEIKPVYLLEILEQLGYITVEEISPNTSGEEFWKYTINNSNSQYSFKTSVKNKGFIESNTPNYKFDIFNDVYNSSKGYGAGSVGLISYLGSHGLFKENLSGKQNEQKRRERSVRFIMDNIYKYVDKNDLVSSEAMEHGKKSHVEIKDYSRLPFKKEGSETAIRTYLTKTRKISPELVDSLVQDGRIFGGYFSQNSFEDGHKLHFNQYFFQLTDANEKVTGAERFNLYENNSGDLKVNKLNISSVKGKAFKIRGDKAKITIFNEAIIDALSTVELIKIAGINPDYFNVFSIQGCPHFNNWLQENIGVGFELNEDSQDTYGPVFAVEFKYNVKPLAPAKIEAYKNTLKNTTINFIDTGTELSSAISRHIEALKTIVNVNIIKKASREDYINYDNYEDNSIFLDETNFELFLRENNLSIQIKDNQSVLMGKEKREVKERLNPTNIQKIKERMREVLGCENIALAFDNDQAGLKYVEAMKLLTTHLGIKAHNMIPDTIQIGRDTDCNDVLKKYHELMAVNKNQEAEQIVTNFIKKVMPDYEIKKKQKMNSKRKIN